MYEINTSTKIDKIFLKLKNKNPKQIEIIYTKLKQIMQNQYHFKPLRNNLLGIRRVHIDKSFVLLYEIDEENKLIILLDYAHHDDIY